MHLGLSLVALHCMHLCTFCFPHLALCVSGSSLCSGLVVFPCSASSPSLPLCLLTSITVCRSWQGVTNWLGHYFLLRQLPVLEELHRIQMGRDDVLLLYVVLVCFLCEVFLCLCAHKFPVMLCAQSEILIGLDLERLIYPGHWPYNKSSQILWLSGML